MAKRNMRPARSSHCEAPSDPFTALWLDLWMLRQEFEPRRFGTPEYDMLHDHAYEVLTVALGMVEHAHQMTERRGGEA